STTDGFLIAEADLKMRGPGDLEGTMQSGMMLNLNIASLATDGQIVQMARDAADSLLDTDPELAQPEHTRLSKLINLIFDRKIDFSLIS
ncbi:MAG: ATP-dependent DNA helicase RecG, partial [Muribaculaceae bacterium]|nr:ATP-dependent DNA helicase RecG [Muribaculaceae bacterium]